MKMKIAMMTKEKKERVRRGMNMMRRRTSKMWSYLRVFQCRPMKKDVSVRMRNSAAVEKEEREEMAEETDDGCVVGESGVVGT
jgi:hypothetical protein